MIYLITLTFKWNERKGSTKCWIVKSCDLSSTLYVLSFWQWTLSHEVNCSQVSSIIMIATTIIICRVLSRKLTNRCEIMQHLGGSWIPVRHSRHVSSACETTRLFGSHSYSHALPTVWKPPLIHCQSELLTVHHMVTTEAEACHHDFATWLPMLFPDWVPECGLGTKQVVVVNNA